MREWSLDLHLHSVLSPCGSSEMLPPAVLTKALETGLNAIAITDHNTAGNAASFVVKGLELGIKVLPGMELQTAEDIHLVCIFDRVDQALLLQNEVYRRLPPLMNNKASLGEQLLVDKEGNVTGEVERLLLTGTNLSVEQGVALVKELGGLCLAAHIDRQAFSLWGHLGMIPPHLNLDGIELTPHLPRNPIQIQELEKEKLSFVVSSDAHYLNDIIEPHCLAYMEEVTVSELRLAFQKEEGRYIRVIG